jgi:hypothetical protein
MNINNPFSFVPVNYQKRLLWPLVVLVLILMFVFGTTGAPLNTDAAPYGVVSFELAGSLERANAILGSWDSIARERAAFGLGLDFLFIPVYVTAIALGCALASRSLKVRQWPLAALRDLLAWGLLLAGLFDIIENIALTITLFGTPSAPYPQIAAACAATKFTLIFLALVYALYGAAVTLLPQPSKN